jgi:hypothetical protein
MLKFYRPNFVSGVIVCKEQITDQNGKQEYIVHKFTVRDQNKKFEFRNEAYLLQKYPVCFTLVR